MVAFQLSAAYHAASKALKREVAREFAASEFGRLYSATRAILRSPATIRGRFRRMASRKRVPGAAQMLREFTGVDYSSLIREVAQYRKGGDVSAALVEEFLQGLGPVGSLLRTLASGGPRAQPDLEAMAELLRAHGYTVLPPEAAPAKQRRAPRGARQYPGERVPPRVKTIELKMASGRYRRFPKQHPIVTAAMIQAPASTNVAEFSYHYDAASLYVRYWAKGKKGGRHKGSMYRYSDVTPEEFLKLYKVRDLGDQHIPGIKSPGTFVWEVLRIPGTVAQHAKSYKLVGVARGYVPRKATEYEYIPRDFKTVKGDWLRSQLPRGPTGVARPTTMGAQGARGPGQA